MAEISNFPQSYFKGLTPWMVFVLTLDQNYNSETTWNLVGSDKYDKKIWLQNLDEKSEVLALKYDGNLASFYVEVKGTLRLLPGIYATGFKAPDGKMITSMFEDAKRKGKKIAVYYLK